jgi:prepilin peptidase dependent protein B
MLNLRTPSSGFNLIELMIGLAVGLIIVTAAISVFFTSMRGMADNTKLVRLNQDMRAMMDIMVRDIRRAGFVTSKPEYFSDLKDNPYFDSVSSGHTTDITLVNNNTCILYAYNRDDDRPSKIKDEHEHEDEEKERLGFRVIARDDGSQMLQMRTSGETNENCGGDDWETITEPEVEITGLTFAMTSTALNATSMLNDTDNDGCRDGDDASPTTASATCKTDSPPYGNGLCDAGESCNTCTRDGSPDPACVMVRYITITLEGCLRDDPAMTQSITETVRVRNDKFLPAIP